MNGSAKKLVYCGFALATGCSDYFVPFQPNTPPDNPGMSDLAVAPDAATTPSDLTELPPDMTPPFEPVVMLIDESFKDNTYLDYLVISQTCAADRMTVSTTIDADGALARTVIPITTVYQIKNPPSDCSIEIRPNKTKIENYNAYSSRYNEYYLKIDQLWLPETGGNCTTRKITSASPSSVYYQALANKPGNLRSISIIRETTNDPVIRFTVPAKCTWSLTNIKLMAVKNDTGGL